jgi:hypothetical protein
MDGWLAMLRMGMVRNSGPLDKGLGGMENEE